MNFKDIKWDQVTSFSQLVAVVLFVAVFAAGFFLGERYEYHAFLNAQKSMETSGPAPLADVVYACDGGKTLESVIFNGKATVVLSDGRSLTLPQTISGSGVRYANADESIVFWSKGDTSFLTEHDKTTYANCVKKQ